MEGVPADQEQQMVALGVLIGAGAILVGYIVKLLVPEKHFAWTAGLIASNVVIATFAYAGVKIAEILVQPWLIVSAWTAICSLIVDFYVQSE